MTADPCNNTVLFDEINKALAQGVEPDVKSQAKDLQKLLDQVNRELLQLVAHPDRRDAGALSNFVTYSLRLKDKLLNFVALAIRFRRQAETETLEEQLLDDAQEPLPTGESDEAGQSPRSAPA